jgi:hypothetical protein
MFSIMKTTSLCFMIARTQMILTVREVEVVLFRKASVTCGMVVVATKRVVVSAHPHNLRGTLRYLGHVTFVSPMQCTHRLTYCTAARRNTHAPSAHKVKVWTFPTIIVTTIIITLVTRANDIS